MVNISEETLLGLKNHLLAHSVKTGDFILKSGKHSSWFIDAKQTLTRPEGMLLAVEAILAILPPETTAIGGLTMGADPVAFATAAVAATKNLKMKSFSVRKQEKGYGQKGRIAGALEAGDLVVVVEDTVTRGTSLLEAAQAVKDHGAIPILALAVVDRGGTVQEMASKQGIKFQCLLSAPDLGFEYEGG